MTEQDANRLFILLGVATFATALPLALALYKSGDPRDGLANLSPLLVFAGLPALATGLLLWRKLTLRELAREQTAGIGIGVLGAMAMCGAIVLAWPNPALLLPATLLNAIVFVGVGVWFGAAEAYLVASVCIAMGYLVGVHLLRGAVDWRDGFNAPLNAAMLSAVSGNALAPLAGLYLAVAGWLRRGGRAREAWWWAISAVVCAAGSLTLVTLFGFARQGDPYGVTATYAFYAAAILAVALVLNHARVAWYASVLLLLALVQGVVFCAAATWHISAPLTTALLAHATLACGIATLQRGWPLVSAHRVRRAFVVSAAWTSSAAALMLLVAEKSLPYLNATGMFAWLAAVWLAIAIHRRSRPMFTAFQAAFAVCGYCAALSAMAEMPWFDAAAYARFDPWFWQVQGVVLALYCSVWIGVRIMVDRSADSPTVRRWSALLNPPWTSFDRICEVVLLGLLLLLSAYAAIPGVAQELAPLDRPGIETRVAPPIETFELPFSPHGHAAGAGGWLLLGCVAITFVVGLWERAPRRRSLRLLLVGAAACPLFAALAEESVSVASALRWLVAGYFVVGSLPIWFRERLRPWMRRMGIAIDADADVHGVPRVSTAAFARLVAVVVGTYLSMALYVSLAAIAKAGIPPLIAPLLGSLVVLAIAAAVVLLVVRLASGGEALSVSGFARAVSSKASMHAQWLIVMLGVGPLVVTYLFVVAAALRLHPLVGPEPDAWFRTIGWSASYGVPLLVFAIALVGHAIRERSARITFAAGLLFHLVATLVYLLELSRWGGTLDGSAWVQVGQINAIVAAIVALIWIYGLTRLRRLNSFAGEAGSRADWPRLLSSEVVIAIALFALPTLSAVVGLVVEPAIWPWVAAAGAPLGWIAAAAAIGAVWVARPHERNPHSLNFYGALVALAIAFLALTLAWRDPGNWLAYHGLLVGYAAAAVALSTARRLGPRFRALRRNSHVANWATGFALAAIALAVRAIDGDPQHPWWTVVALVLMAAVFVRIAWCVARRRYLWIAGTLCNLAATIWWLDAGWRWLPGDEVVDALHGVAINIIAASLGAVVSVVVEHRRIAPRRLPENLQMPGFHHLALLASHVALAALAVIGLFGDALHAHLALNWPLISCALLATSIAAVVCLLEPLRAVASLHGAGLIAVLLAIDYQDLTGDWLAWALAIALAGYALLTSIVWRQRGRLFARVEQLRSAGSTMVIEGQAWLLGANAALGVVATALALWGSLYMRSVHSGPFAERTTATLAILAAAISIALLAEGVKSELWRLLALALGALFAVALGWAQLPLDLDFRELHRVAVAAVALAATVLIDGLGLFKLAPPASGWSRSLVHFLPALVIATAAALVMTLQIELQFALHEAGVPLAWPVMIAVLAGIVALSLAALTAAVAPGNDPLDLSERGRTAYVYAAEILLVLGFLHIRLTMPWLFHGWFTRFWPLVVVAIAFLGAGFGELFQRRRVRVLSEPLQNTGALLPLLPALGFWLLPSHVHYSVLLLAIAALYSMLCLVRGSLLFGMLAAVAANGSLWYWLHTLDGVALSEHPQLWLIPPALSILIAAHLNRRAVIQRSQHPAELVGISLVGIFAGILLQVRAFLFLGMTFLLVALLTVIWYAAVEQERTWIWWVSGIVTGAAIIVMFGLFEKKRDDMLRLVERLKQWEA